MHLASNAAWVLRTALNDFRQLTDTGRTMNPYRATFHPTFAQAMQDRALEWFSALAMLLCGLALSTQSEVLHGPAWDAFHAHGNTEELWATTFALTGAARLVALYINGRWPKTPLIRILGSTIGAVCWSQLSYLLIEGEVLNGGVFTLGSVVYGLLALADLFSVFRAAFDARYHHP